MDNQACAFWHEVTYHTIIADNVLIPARVNPTIFYLLWTCAPNLVSLVSFLIFVMQGSQLTIKVTLTVGTLIFTYTVRSLIDFGVVYRTFRMVRTPMNAFQHGSSKSSRYARLLSS